MIKIDKVEFDFVVPEMEFANRLYSDWDTFCHNCFEHLVEEYFMPYDDDGIIYEIGKIEFDLGNIPEERFYEEYPRRLKEKLTKILLPVGNHIDIVCNSSSRYHIDSFIFSLKNGFSKRHEFKHNFILGIEHEIEWLNTLSDTERENSLHEISGYVLTDNNVLCRMLMYVDNESLLIDIFHNAISLHEYTDWQKNQFLISFLELKGDIPVKYIHESDGGNDLSLMAKLLDSRSVRSIMQNEMNMQNRVGMVAYWHYLYEWLLRYYPYNSVSLFGAKVQFILHLHTRLLIFIHNHTYLSYFSEYELTLEFLIEVFGRDQYINVAEAINLLLRQNVGNVAYESSYGKELYKTFQRISSLHHIYSLNKTDVVDSVVATHLHSEHILQLKQIFQSTNIDGRIKQKEVASVWESNKEFYAELVCMLDKCDILDVALEQTKDNIIKDIISHASTHVYENESLKAVLLICQWLQTNIADNKSLETYLSPVTNGDFINRLLASESLSLLEAVHELKKNIMGKRNETEWLRRMSDSEFNDAWNMAVLLWMSGKEVGLRSIEQLLCLFYKHITGSSDSSNIDSLLQGDNVIVSVPEPIPTKHPIDCCILNLRRSILSADITGRKIRREAAVLWDRYKGAYSELIGILYKEGLLSIVTTHTSDYAIKELIRQLTTQNYSREQSFIILLVCDWLVENKTNVKSFLRSNSVDIYAQVLLWLVRFKKDNVELCAKELYYSLLTFLFDNSDFELINKEIVGCYHRNPDIYGNNSLFYDDNPGEDIIHVDNNKLDNVPDRTMPLLDIVMVDMSEHKRRRLLQSYLFDSPRELLKYIRQSVKEGVISESQWGEWLDKVDWRSLSYGISVSVTDLFIQIIELLHLDERTECMVWPAFIVRHDDEEWLYNTKGENASQFIDVLYYVNGTNNIFRKKIEQSVMSSLGIELTDTETKEDVHELHIGNAGLCMLAPWFLRLYDMLGYLDDEHRMFRNTSSRVRAVFLLQYLVYGEEREHNESELYFNRLLTDLPLDVPLPKRVVLSDKEKETADGMIAGVKANWQKMNGTSVEGFRKSFILRGGTMNRKDDHWIVTVEEHSYDILLDTIPWGFRQIRFPWIKTFIQIYWHDKQII